MTNLSSKKPTKTVSSPAPEEPVEIQALAVGVKILDLLAQARSPLSAATIARQLDMTPPRVWRHLNSMQTLGLVDNHSGQRGFVLGWKLVQLGHAAVDRSNITEVAHAHIAELRDALGETVYLAIPYRDGTSVVMSMDGTARISLHLPVGTFFAGHASASGRIAMAFSTPERIRQFLASSLLEAASPHPIADPRELSKRFAQIRTQFFETAENKQSDRTSGTVYINAVGSPIFNHRDEIAGTVGILTGIADDEAIRAKEILQPLFRCAANISGGLGSSKWQNADLIYPLTTDAEDEQD